MIDICDVCHISYEARDLIQSKGELLPEPIGPFTHGLRLTCRKCKKGQEKEERQRQEARDIAIEFDLDLI